MKKAVFLIALTLSVSLNGTAQQRKKSVIRKTAIADAKQFKLSKPDSIQFKKEHRRYRSDLLKPTKLTTTDTLLLQDSLYNDVFRSVALANNTKNRSVVYASIAGGVVLIVCIIIVASGKFDVFKGSLTMPM